MEFFKNEGMKNIFILTQTDGKNRVKLLNITINLFENKTASKSWYNEILSTIEEYKETPEGASAIKILNKIYKDMN